MHRLAGLRANAQQLAVARILIGLNAAFAALEASRMLPRLLTPIVVKIPFSPLVPVLPSSALRLFLAVWLVAALAFALGWKTRVAGGVLALVTGYTLVLDQQTYSNHLYLLFLVILLLTIRTAALLGRSMRGTPAERSRGLADPLTEDSRSDRLLFSAVAKITPSASCRRDPDPSLKQEDGWLSRQSWRTPATVSLLAVTSIVRRAL
jgi:hypothetical protein